MMDDKTAYLQFLTNILKGGTLVHVVANGRMITILRILITNNNVNVIGPFVMDGPFFVQNISKLFKDYKAMILSVFLHESPEYKNNLAFCEEIRKRLVAAKIPYVFKNDDALMGEEMLVGANTAIKPNENIMIVRIDLNMCTFFKLEYTAKGYKASGRLGFKVQANATDDDLCKKIIGEFKPNKIIACSFMSTNQVIPALKKYASKNSCGVIVLDSSTEVTRQYKEKHFVEMLKWISDKSYTKYFILPSCINTYCITANSTDMDNVWGTVPIFEALPLTKTFEITTKLISKFYLTCYNEGTKKLDIISEKAFDRNCHRTNVIISIDANNFVTFRTEPFISPIVETYPYGYSRIFNPMIPVIKFFDDSSTLCLCKKGKQIYEYADGWNGMYGEELILSFTQEKPSFGSKALANNKFSFMVYDLLTIMSMPQDDIKAQKHWKFAISKDENYPVLIEFDQHDGKRGAQSPAFLMAMLLKEHIKVIKKESGEKPKKLAFDIPNFYDESSQHRIEKQLEESCQLLKVECTFLPKRHH